MYSITSDLPTFLHSEEIGIKTGKITSIELYPNPAGNYLNVSTPNNQMIDRFEIYDLSGKLIKNISYKLNRIDVSQLNSGVYLLKVSIKDKIYSGKFIKK